MSQNVPLYEPRFYERAAQRHVARIFPGQVFVNVRWGLIGSPASRHELDALVFRTRQAVPVEVKAHSIGSGDMDEIVAKYRRIGFSRIILVAPGISLEASRCVADGKAPCVEFVLFRPDLDVIRDWYCAVWPQKVPGWAHSALASGRHHVRFVLSRPTGRGRFVIGQQRTRVYSVDTVLRLAVRLPAPPARVLWTPQRFTTPRDLIARGSRVTALGGFVPIDIDGDRLHQAFHACQISRSDAVCQFCIRYADAEYRSLAQQLDETPVDVLASGGRGVHVYYEDHGDVRERVVKLSRAHAIRLDENITTSLKSTVALPGSLHAGSMQPVESIMKAAREVTQCS
ncbi:MAG: hypothetical protein ACRDRU_29860 [Pseudonocardiaceae bacterium]